MPTPPATSHSQSQHPLRMLAWGVLILAALYGMLYGVGRATLPATYALASVAPYAGVLEARAVSVAGTDDLALGFEALLEAPRQTLGLFPYYDAASVRRAIRYLSRAYERAEVPAQRAEVAFFLAKAHLMNQDPDATRSWLATARIQKTPAYQDDATALLDALLSVL